MSNKDELNFFKRELNLILAQNPIECEMYSVIAELLRRRKSVNNYSLRDVSTRRKCRSGSGDKFLTQSGFPDFAIMTTGKDPEMLGAVEIKWVGANLDNPKSMAQLEGHTKRQIDNKPLPVLYTNGLEWRFYAGTDESGKPMQKKPKITIGKISEEHIIVWEDSKWACLIEFLEEINWIN